SRDDLETLLLFTLKHKNDKIVTIGMGEKGIPSRIINPVFGSLITYASLKTKSAPGQLLLSDMINIFRTLGLR
ncbi:MAG: type I 3-dehydroquinate dehydratase, partial [Thermodesulfovibrio sp.]|nr:type I 3-dehydroquinate dehydratase [Thermodesulfovibrio sp.]